MASAVKAAPVRTSLGYERPMFRTLLVVEDPSDVRYYHGMLLAMGHEVEASATYEDALASLGRQNFDMVVVSQGSPAFEGRPVLARAREINPERPVLVVTRALDIDCYLEALEMGAADYIERCAAPRDFMLSVDANLRMKKAA